MGLKFLSTALLSLFVTQNTWAAAMPAFTTFGNGFTPKKETETVITNMPKVMSQDTLGICYSFAAAAVMQANNCRIQRQDCPNLSEADTFSPLDVARFGQKPDGENSYESSYKGIHDGGPAGFTLEVAALFVGSSASEACMSLDKILSKIGGAKYGTDVQLAAFNRLKKLYAKSRGVNGGCSTCYADFYSSAKSQIDQDFNVNKNQAEIARAFAEDTYDKALDALFSPKECARAKNRAYYEGKSSTEIDVFPKNGKTNYADSVAKIKETLKKGYPLILQGICLEDKITPQCTNQHASVISGFRTVCDKSNTCYDSVKVHNSWGQSWQDATGGGWVAAKELLDSTYYPSQMLTWLKDKQ